MRVPLIGPVLAWIFMPKTMSGRFVFLTILFLATFFTLVKVGHPVVSDSRFSMHTAMSIISERNTDLDEYASLTMENDNYCLKIVNGHLYSQFPIGPSLIEVPFILAVMPFTNLSNAIKASIPTGSEHLIAAAVVALTAVFIYQIGQLFFRERRYSLLLTFIFTFCTSAWSTASLNMSQHGPSMLFLTINLYLILLARKTPALIQYAALPLAFSYVMRPTNSISILLLSAFVFIYYRRYFIRYLLWALPVAIPFVIFNLIVYHLPLSTYYFRTGRTQSVSSFLVGLSGTIVSPGRGLLIFSPILALSIVGLVMKRQGGGERKLDYFLAGIIVLNWVTFASIDVWWGGHSFGPRFFTDMMPYMIYLLIPVLMFMAKSRGVDKICIGWCVLLLISISFFVHYKGATSIKSQSWNYQPDVNTNPGRLWDWRDISFFR